jgi:predicted RNA methylase
MNPVETYLLNCNKNKIKIYSENNEIINHFNKKESYAHHIINDINMDRLYDIFLINMKKKDLIVLDLGANIGLFTLFIQERCKMVYSIEPTPSHFEILNDEHLQQHLFYNFHIFLQ